MGVARPQESGDELTRLSIEDQERVIDVLPEVAVVVALFLIAMGGIIGGIEVQQNLLWSTILGAIRG